MRRVWISNRVRYQVRIWIVPALYIIGAVALSRLVPLIQYDIFGSTVFSPGTATAMLSAVSSGMIAFTGFGFSLSFVLIQSGNTTYSPRLAGLFLQDAVVRHSLGMFIATFIYSLLTLTMVDVLLTGHLLDYAVLLVLLCLLASMVMFLALIQRFTLLQVNNILNMLGDRGRNAIAHLYPVMFDPAKEVLPLDKQSLPPVTQTIGYQGSPATLLDVNLAALTRLARDAGGLIEMDYAVGDTVSGGAPFLRIRGATKELPHINLRRLVDLGSQRTIEQDPKYAIRLIVDIAVRALSPAMNDPSTAVQALDQLDDLLRRVVQRHIGREIICDSEGIPRVVYPLPEWQDFLSLAFDEIRIYGTGSLQVMRRLRAVLEDLEDAAPPPRKPAVRSYRDRVANSILRAFADPQDQLNAGLSDRQGIGVSRELVDDDDY